MAKQVTQKAECAGCGNQFASRNRGRNRGWTRYCSNACYGRSVTWKGGPEASRRRRRYGIEPEEYEAMLAEQGGACALCGTKPDYTLYVDHDHATGRARALLCAGCNTEAGVFDRLTWEQVLNYWAFSHGGSWRCLAIACQESGNVPRDTPPLH